MVQYLNVEFVITRKENCIEVAAGKMQNLK